MFRYLLVVLFVALIGAIWLIFYQFKALNEEILDVHTRVDRMERQAGGGEDEERPADKKVDELAVLERIQKLEAEIAARPQGTGDPVNPAEMVRPQPKPILVRKYTNQADGKTVDAQLVAVDGANVTIRRIDGKEFTFPIARLTRDDQIYIAEHAASIDALSAGGGSEVESSDNTFGFDGFFDDGN